MTRKEIERKRERERERDRNVKELRLTLAPSAEGDRLRPDVKVEPVGPCHHRWNRAGWEQPEQDGRKLEELVELVKPRNPWNPLKDPVPSRIQLQDVVGRRAMAGTHAVGSGCKYSSIQEFKSVI